MTIVALGTSNTYGRGVARGQTYPAQLQAMLITRGINARVINAGVNGHSNADLLVRMNSAVPNGTRLVVIETASPNEIRENVAWHTGENMRSRVGCIDISGEMHAAIRAAPWGSDLKQLNRRLTAAGYATLVPSLVSDVAAALGKSGPTWTDMFDGLSSGGADGAVLVEQPLRDYPHCQSRQPRGTMPR